MHSLFLTCLSVGFAALLAVLSTSSLVSSQVTHTFKSSKDSTLPPSRAVSTRQFVSRPVIEATASEATNHAFSVIGTPCRWGGTTPEKGFDCSGLVNYVLRSAGDVDLPWIARAAYNVDSNKVSRGKLQSGDLVSFRIRNRSVDHVGVYVSNNCFVHAPRCGKKVRVSDLNSSYWKHHYLTGKRILSTALAQVGSTRKRWFRRLRLVQMSRCVRFLNKRVLSRPVDNTASQIGAQVHSCSGRNASPRNSTAARNSSTGPT